MQDDKQSRQSTSSSSSSHSQSESRSKKENQFQIDLSKYKAGVRVYHKKFGEGIITAVEEEGDDLKVDISFDKAGNKRLMAKYANLEII